MKKKTQGSETAAPKSVPIKSLEDLLALTNKPLLCRFKVDDATVELNLKRLKAAEDEAVYALERDVVPPVIRDEKTKSVLGYDEANVDYRSRLAEVRKQQRALRIYLGCEAIRQGKPDLKDIKEITTFVQSLLHEQILDYVNATLEAGGVGVAERVNFTSAPDSAQS